MTFRISKHTFISVHIVIDIQLFPEIPVKKIRKDGRLYQLELYYTIPLAQKNRNSFFAVLKSFGLIPEKLGNRDKVPHILTALLSPLHRSLDKLFAEISLFYIAKKK